MTLHNKVASVTGSADGIGKAIAKRYLAEGARVVVADINEEKVQATAEELGRQGINVNAIAPGVVGTPMWDSVDALFAKYEGLEIGQKRKMVGEAVPFGRMGLSEDLTGAAVFLASQDSEYIVAQALNVCGGNWMS